MEPLKIVAFFHLHELRWNLADEDRARVERRFAGVRLVSIEDAADLPAALADAEVFVGFTFPRQHFAAARRLRWVQSASAGIEANLFPEMVASDVVLTNGAGLHSLSIPEHVLAQMLVLARNFHEAARLQAARQWNRFQCIAFGGGVRELCGSRLAILGAGAIGRSLAQKAAALGQHVRVLRRDASRPVPGAEVCGPEALDELLRWADFVVLALPLTPATRGLIGERALAAMKSDAYLINVGRGELIDEAALVRALERGAIAGAALDVFQQEPLPPEHPFWGLPNAVLTPHVSGYTPNYFRKVLDLFEENLERFRDGRPLRNVVDKRLGYSPPEV
jgi:phosphoglycerate dehydrogenase-like enzyme